MVGIWGVRGGGGGVVGGLSGRCGERGCQFIRVWRSGKLDSWLNLIEAYFVSSRLYGSIASAAGFLVYVCWLMWWLCPIHVKCKNTPTQKVTNTWALDHWVPVLHIE